MTKISKKQKDFAQKIYPQLASEYPDANCALNHKNALQLLIATILSAQCTDERVNIVTKDLFKKYKNVKAFADADLEELEQDVRSTGFYRNKAKSIKNAAISIIKNYKGKVPDKMDELLTLPGVARKTANVVLGNIFGINDGVVVDTHVKRLSGRMGFTKQTDPNKIEQDLMQLIPQEEWTVFSHRMISHGRKVCNARSPKCSDCFLENDCPSAHKAK